VSAQEAEALSTATQSETPLHKNKRFVCIFVLLFVCTLLITGRVGQLMLFPPSSITTKYQADHEYGLLPAIRGRILSADGTVLAWSTRHLGLLWEVPDTISKIREDWAEICTFSGIKYTLVSEALGHAGKQVRLIADIKPEDFQAITSLSNSNPRFEIDNYFIRHRHKAPGLRAKLGYVRELNGIEIGISGAERKHDNVLRGRSGIYSVMLDSDGNWLENTWTCEQKLTPGYDVYLDFNIESLQ
jgi:cell division protein FtsI/penicillin-binding protein 2